MKLRRSLALISMLALAAIAAPQGASAQTKVRFTLDWVPGATHSAFFVALQKGYYKAEGLDVSITVARAPPKSCANWHPTPTTWAFPTSTS
jgi:ABC-type nitrate/sulfonate/bicarbonate transport system substrate-binding protein